MYYWQQCLFFVNLDLLEYFVTIFYNKLTELLSYLVNLPPNSLSGLNSKIVTYSYYLVRNLVRTNRFLLVIDIIRKDLNAASDINNSLNIDWITNTLLRNRWKMPHVVVYRRWKMSQWLLSRWIVSQWIEGEMYMYFDAFPC